MADYNSKSTEEPGQYPAPNFTIMGLPEQSFGSGAPGAAPTDTSVDAGSTNEPGQYPSRDTFTHVPLGGSGAPGSAGISAGHVAQGPDRVTFDEPTFYKGQQSGDAQFDDNGFGYEQEQEAATVSGKGDWTQANAYGYQAPDQWQMPGVAGNTPAPGDGDRHQTGAGNVMYGGWLKGSRPGTANHPGYSGPGT